MKRRDTLEEMRDCSITEKCIRIKQNAWEFVGLQIGLNNITESETWIQHSTSLFRKVNFTQTNSSLFIEVFQKTM